MKRMLVSLLALTMALMMFAGMYPAYAEGSAPVAENLELKTYKNVSVGGKLSAFDPDGGALSFEISTQPVKGEIELSEDGSFVYTPAENKKGRDYFGYRATDEQGNSSQEATVIIKIEKQKKAVFYPELHGTADEYAATALSEAGIFTGEQLCGVYSFEADREVRRGEFLSMCMTLSGEPIVSSVMSTKYNDDSSIPGWMKPYVATASIMGVEPMSAGSSFAPDEVITRQEAAVMLNSILGLSPVSYISLDESMDGELAQACANLQACGIFDGAATADTLTRREAAHMLVNALDMTEK